MEILKIIGLKKSFGNLQAVGGVDLTVKAKEIRAIIGPNGAGKTTFFNLITGNLKADDGKVYFKGKLITGLPIHQIMRLGVGRSFQITNIFPQLTVFENVLVSVVVQQKREFTLFRPALKIAEVDKDIMSVLQLIGLENDVEKKGHALSHGDKKRMELAIVLASKPDLILLDEPTAGMSPEETDMTVKLIRDLSSKLGITIVFTEHDMKVVFGISDFISVLYQGNIIAEGLPHEVRNNKRVIEAYIGENSQ